MKKTKIMIMSIIAQCSLLLSHGATVNLFIIKQYIPENPIILEAGAHHGEDTIKISQFWPLGTIYAFEPLPCSYIKLQKNVHTLTNVLCFPLALADKTCYADFYFDSIGTGDNGASSLYKPGKELQKNYDKNPLRVPAITIDEWVHQYGISHIDFLWLDMEGAELAALKSSPKILETVSAIHIEVNFRKFWDGIPLYDEVKQWLNERHFMIAWQSLDTNWQGNVLFVRNNNLQNK